MKGRLWVYDICHKDNWIPLFHVSFFRILQEPKSLLPACSKLPLLGKLAKALNEIGITIGEGVLT